MRTAAAKRARRHLAPLPSWWQIKGHRQLAALVALDGAARVYHATESGPAFDAMRLASDRLTAAYSLPGTAFAGMELPEDEVRRLWSVADAVWCALRQMERMLEAETAGRSREATEWAKLARANLDGLGGMMEVAA
jgi:hypothetical protein